jgi:GTP-sensing pleiotropic transcriptional regulator CodY
MAGKKIALKTPDTGNLTSFAELMGKFGGTPEAVDSNSTRVEPESTHMLLSVDSKSTDTSLSVDSKSTHIPLSVEPQPTQGLFTVDLNSTHVELQPTRVELKSTLKLQSVDSKSTEAPLIVDSKSTIIPIIVDRESTRVEPKSTLKLQSVDSKSTPSAYWYSQNRDFYLIGVWHVLTEVLGTDARTVTLRPLASRLGMDASFLRKVLRRLDAAGMVRLISQKDGTFIEILNPAWSNSPHEEEGDFKNKLPPHRRIGRNFQREMELRDALEAIFWGCLSVMVDVNSLSGTTINYLAELSVKRSAGYAAGIAIKYIKAARHPLSFLQTVFNKEPDPLSKAEVDKGKEIMEAGAEILRNIDRIEELGLIGMKALARHFPSVDLGKTIESGRSALKTLRESHDEFFEKWRTAP